MLIVIVKSVFSRDVYVDIDGTVFDNSLDDAFRKNGFNTKWYEQQYVGNLNVNRDLVKCLKVVRLFGCRLHVFTNRGFGQARMTLENLGEYKNLFDSYEFCEGCKGKYSRKGLLIDNEEKYSDVCDSYVQVKF